MSNKIAVRAGVVAGAILLAALGLWAAWRAVAVEGGDPAQRVASVGRLTDGKPAGAAGALARAAASAQEDPTVRQAALAALAQFPGNDYRPVVEEALRDPLPNIRAAAATTLGTYGDVAACDRLGNMVLGDPDPAARIGAVKGLALNASPNALAWLVRVAERETTPAVHRQVLFEAYAKVNCRYFWGDSESATETQRLTAAENLKGYIQVQEAYRIASWPLERRPEFKKPHVHEVENHAPTK